MKDERGRAHPLHPSSFIPHPSPMWPAIWRGRWVWAERPPSAGIGSPGGLPPRETWNRFVYFRRSFALESVPETVPARVTADSRFVLYVNGREVARGPARA